MRIAIISDIHGNYPALEKVIEDARLQQAEQFVFIGDYIFDMPFSNQVAELLMSLNNAHIIKGNKESYLVAMSKENQADWVYNQMGAVYQTYRELKSDVFDFLSSLKDDLYIPLGQNKKMYATHYFDIFRPNPKTNCSSSNFHKKMEENPFSHDDFLQEFTDLINGGEYKSCIDNIDADVILFGHNHLQAHGFCGDKLIINPGSCGQPLDFIADAPYTILEITPTGFNVIERRVKYDIEAAIRAAKTSAVYQRGRIWLELVFLALRTGRDYFGLFFETADTLAQSKGEEGAFYSNQTWSHACKNFKDKFPFFEA